MSDSRLLPTGSSPLEIAAAKACAEIEKRRSVFVSCGTRTPVRQICCRGWRGRFRSTGGMKSGRKRQKRAVIRDAYFIHCHKGTIGAIRRVVEPLGYLINVTGGGKTVTRPAPSGLILVYWKAASQRQCIRKWNG